MQVCVCDRKRSQPLRALVWGIIPRNEHCKNLVKTQHQSLKQTPEDLFTGARHWEPRNSSLRPAAGTQPSKPLALPGSHPVCGRLGSLLTRPSPREEGAGLPSLQPQSLWDLSPRGAPTPPLHFAPALWAPKLAFSLWCARL